MPSFSHTGKFKNLLSCIVCNASITVISGDTDSGLGVITVLTTVCSRGNSFATALLIISLKPNIPTSLPFSTTNAAFFASAIATAVFLRLVPGVTIVAGLPERRLRNVGEALPPNACAISGPSSCVNIAACCPPAPCNVAICFTASSAALLLCSSTFSSLLIASFKHFAMSSTPTIAPLSSTTGRCLK